MDIADQFNVAAILKRADNIDNDIFIRLFRESDAIHIDIYGDIDYENPLESSFSLREEFRIVDLQRVASRAKLIFLTACLTSLGASTTTNNITGF
jgi:hypothetical protein